MGLGLLHDRPGGLAGVSGLVLRKAQGLGLCGVGLVAHPLVLGPALRDREPDEGARRQSHRADGQRVLVELAVEPGRRLPGPISPVARGRVGSAAGRAGQARGPVADRLGGARERLFRSPEGVGRFVLQVRARRAAVERRAAARRAGTRAVDGRPSRPGLRTGRVVRVPRCGILLGAVPVALGLAELRHEPRQGQADRQRGDGVRLDRVQHGAVLGRVEQRGARVAGRVRKGLLGLVDQVRRVQLGADRVDGLAHVGAGGADVVGDVVRGLRRTVGRGRASGHGVCCLSHCLSSWRVWAVVSRGGERCRTASRPFWSRT